MTADPPQIAWEDSHGRLWQGDVRACLAAMEPESVQVCVTSPPYWSLRNYGTDPQVWGNHNGCEHEWGVQTRPGMTGGSAKVGLNGGANWQDATMFSALTSATCNLCQAIRCELGSEPLHDCAGWATGAPCGACFICHLVEVFTVVKRVLRPDGVCFVNLGDSYSGSGKGPTGTTSMLRAGTQELRQGFVGGKSEAYSNGSVMPYAGRQPAPGLKQKDLVGIPWRFALAMQASGWWLRGDYIWSKPNPMPESVTDRCTRSHEYIFHFSKASTYYWDADAIREGYAAASLERYAYDFKAYGADHPNGAKHGAIRDGGEISANPAGRNARSVWEIPTQATPLAHFATFPQALVRRAILAGSSERGACAACGAPHKRIVKVSGGTTGQSWHNHENDAERGQRGGDNGNVAAAGWKTYQREDLGWAPTCTCACPDTRPCVVLDPFAGSSTTLLVARQLGRIGWGAELNPDYVAMSLNRLRQHVLL